MNIKELNKKIIGIIGLAIIASLGLGLFLGSMMVKEVIITEYITLPPQIITKTVEVIKYKNVEVPVEVPIIIREKEIIVKEIEVPVLVMLRNFESEDELIDFLANDDTDTRITLKMNAAGSANLTGVCEDRAIQLQERAMKAGFIMSFQSVGTMELNASEQWILTGRGHAICSVIIGNECLFIEPSTDEYWIGAYLD